MKVAGKDFKGYEYADGTHWHWGEKEVAIINDYTAEIEWCCRKSSLPDDVIKAIYDRKPKPSGKWVKLTALTWVQHRGKFLCALMDRQLPALVMKNI